MRPCRDYATANVSREGRAWTLLAIHVTAVQQIAGFWLLPIRVQEGRSASAAQETRARRHPDEKLHAEAAGENRIYIYRVGCRPVWMTTVWCRRHRQSAYRRTELDQ